MAITIPLFSGQVLDQPPQEPVTHTLRYATQVLRSLDGREQRIARTSNPRWEFEATYRVQSASEAIAFKRRLVIHANDEYAFPIWWDKYYTTSDASAAATTIFGSFTDMQLETDDLILMVRPDGTRLGRVVVNKANGFITFSDGLPSLVPEGTVVYPMHRFKLRDNTTFGRAADSSVDIRLVLDKVRLAPPPGAVQSGSAEFYGVDSDRVLPRPDNPGTTAEEYRSYLERFDSSNLQFQQFTDVGQSDILYPRRWTLRSAEDWRDFYSLAQEVLGARGRVYASTYMHDVNLTQVVSNGDNFLDAEYDQGWFDLYKDVQTFRNLMIQKSDGTYELVAVSTVADLGGGEMRLNLDTNLSLTGGQTVDKVSLLERGHFATDVFKFTHYSNYATVENTVQVSLL